MNIGWPDLLSGQPYFKNQRSNQASVCLRRWLRRNLVFGAGFSVALDVLFRLKVARSPVDAAAVDFAAPDSL